MVPLHDGERLRRCVGGAVAPVAGQSVVGVRDPDHPCFKWDLIAFQAVGIAAAIEILVVVQDDQWDERIQAQRFDKTGTYWA